MICFQRRREAHPVKPRQPRQHVVLNSRLRSGATWSDACILNVSARGLGLQAVAPPVQGTYVEVRRGNNVIVARVVWVKGQRFGAITQNVISIADLSGERIANDRALEAANSKVERVVAQPRSNLYERSRAAGQTLEFAFLGILAISAAFAALGMAATAIGYPLATINIALSSP